MLEHDRTRPPTQGAGPGAVALIQTTEVDSTGAIRGGVDVEVAEAIRRRFIAGERLTPEENDILVAYVDSFTDAEWSEKTVAESEAAKPLAQREFETAIRAWWDQHNAWLRDGCPEGGDPGPQPVEPPGLYPPPKTPLEIAVEADERMKKWGMEPYHVKEHVRCREANAIKMAAVQAAMDRPPVRRVEPLEAMILDRVQRLRVDAEARRRLRAEQEGPATPLDVSLGVELALRAEQAQPWRVEGLMPAEGATLLSAQRKTGKTTLALNLIRSLLTSEPFLGAFEVEPPEGRVALLNYEVAGPQIGRWAAEAGVPLDRLVVANLRGRRNPLGHDDDRAALAQELLDLGVEVLIVDPFANAFTGEDQNNAGHVAAFLHSLDRFAREEVGATDLVLVNHAGWQGDRSRGSSALEDWPDAIVRLTMDNHGTRYLSAMGRDVDVPEGRLDFDPKTRRLTLDRTTNAWSAAYQARTTELVEAIVAVATEVPGLGVRDLQDMLTARGVKFAKADLQPAIAIGASAGRLEQRTEARGKKALYATSETASNSDRPDRPGTVPGTVPTVPVPLGTGRSTDIRDAECPEASNNQATGGTEPGA